VSSPSLHVAVVGLSFGKFFVPIYRDHPQVRQVSICEPNAQVLNDVGDEFGIASRYSSLDEILANPDIDAVHLLTPVPFHVEQTLAVLASGKHCACAVPMAETIEDIHRIIAAAKAAQKNYMMMETVVYGREFMYVLDLKNRGLLGDITFLQANYYQDLEATYGEYWKAVPPMHYATHSVAPLLGIAGVRARKVSCLGAGKLRKDIYDSPDNPFPMQTAHFRLEGSDAVMQVNRAWYQVARQFAEAFSVYGEKRAYEWPQVDHEDPVVFELEPPQKEIRWRDATPERVKLPIYSDLLPESLGKYAEHGHSGAHPHMVHEFVSSIIEGRPAWIDPIRAADWSAPGICAHQSSLQDGAWVEIPRF
jgi:predicted dehydrogenase